jgi:hypothetical protein
MIEARRLPTSTDRYQRRRFRQDLFPRAKPPSTPEWGVTEARNVAEQTSAPGRKISEEARKVRFTIRPRLISRLPEAERANTGMPPPCGASRTGRTGRKEKGGIPLVWVRRDARDVLLFIIVLGVVYFIIIRNVGYQVSLKGAPPKR